MPRYYLISLLATLCFLPVTITTSQAFPLPEAAAHLLPHDHLSVLLAANWRSLPTDFNGETEVVAINRLGNSYSGGKFSAVAPIERTSLGNIRRVTRYGDETAAMDNLAGGYPEIQVLPNPYFNGRFPDFRVFPLPTRDGRLQVQGLPQAQRIKVRIFDISGNVVRWQILRKPRIEMADLPDGMYLLAFEFGGESVFAKVQMRRTAP